MSEEAERRLLSEADYLYDIDNWECTCNDLLQLAETTDLYSDYGGKVLTVGRLKEMSRCYAVNVPIAWTDGEPDDWEVRVFGTREAAEAAYRATHPKDPHHAD